MRTSKGLVSLGLAVASFAWPGPSAEADCGWVREEKDDRGRVLSVEPQQNTSIRMQKETVTLVPYYDPSVSKDHPLLYVNVSYAFENPDAATTLRLGFPDMRGKVLREDHLGCAQPEMPSCGGHTTAPDDKGGSWGTADLQCPGTIETFSADSAGRSLTVTAGPGTADYLRWFVFDMPFPAHGTATLRNRYVARVGYVSSYDWIGYELTYILHTGSAWSGSIGEGEISTWEGGWRELRHFTGLRPDKTDDLHADLDVTETRTAGRPLLHADDGAGVVEDEPRRFERSKVVRSSSRRPGATSADLPSLAAMAIDRDPATAWVDDGANGGVGEWLEIPVYRVERIRALSMTQGKLGPGLRGIKRLRLGCFSLDGSAHQSIEVDHLSLDVADIQGEQQLVLPRPLADCDSLRLTTEELFGGADNHASIAEVGFEAP